MSFLFFGFGDAGGGPEYICTPARTDQAKNIKVLNGYNKKNNELKKNMGANGGP